LLVSKKNRDPSGRELWEGARVEAAPAGGRVFYDAVVMKIRYPEPSAFDDVDNEDKDDNESTEEYAAGSASYDVKFDSGRRENVPKERVRIPAKCKTCGRAKGAVPSWESGNDLSIAAKRGNLPVVIQMTESGADLEKPTLSGETPVMLAASAGWHLIIDYLIAQRVNLKCRNQEGSTALALAAAKGHMESVRSILEMDKTIASIKDGLGRTPLLVASAGGHAAVVKLLCRADRKQVNEADDQGLTPFYKASSGGHTECMKILLESGADRFSLSQSSTRVRDLHSHGGAMNALNEITPDGRDRIYSKVLNRRLRNL
jgi:ankyrin repeat protein